MKSSGPLSDFVRHLLDRGARLAVDPRARRLIRLERLRAERERQQNEYQRLLDRMHDADDREDFR